MKQDFERYLEMTPRQLRKNIVDFHGHIKGLKKDLKEAKIKENAFTTLLQVAQEQAKKDRANRKGYQIAVAHLGNQLDFYYRSDVTMIENSIKSFQDGLVLLKKALKSKYKKRKSLKITSYSR